MFYDGRPSALEREVRGYLSAPARAPRAVCGVVVPHAGYPYSGAICGRAVASAVVPQRVLILHTKHHPGGGTLALAPYRSWQTPLGEVQADEGLSAGLAELPGVTLSEVPHRQEHAAEVVLPFLQLARADLRVAVISVGHAPYEALCAAGERAARVLADVEGPTLVVISTDMNHYASQAETERKDALALRPLAAFDPAGLLAVCDRHEISMCGVAATVLGLALCRERGATRVELLEHATSAAVSGDYSHVVGYASALIL